MAAITLDRTGITLTNDTGTPASPVGDGTLLNAADRTAVLDRIDQLFNGTRSATFTFGTILAVEGFGTHNFSAGSAGANVVAVRNTSAGTGNYAGLLLGNNSASNIAALFAFSSTYTTAGMYFASGVNLESTGAGGLSVWASNASGDLRFGSGGSQRGVLTSGGRWAFGTTTAGTDTIARVGGSLTAASSAATGLLVDPTLTGLAGQSIFGVSINPTLVEAASGTHSFVLGTVFSAPTITAGAASVTTAATVYIAGATAASGAANYALYVAGGSIKSLGQTLLGNTTLTTTTLQVGYLTSQEAGIEVESNDFGGSTKTGSFVKIGYNNNGGGAAGTLRLVNKSGTTYYLWVSSTGVLRIHTAAPTADGSTVADTAGSPV